MTNYVVSGAGTAAANGVYTDQGANPAYTSSDYYSNGTYYLYYTTFYGELWIISPVLNGSSTYNFGYTSSAYNDIDPSKNPWSVAFAASPAPTVTTSGSTPSRRRITRSQII